MTFCQNNISFDMFVYFEKSFCFCFAYTQVCFILPKKNPFQIHILIRKEKKMLYLTMHSTPFIYGFMALDHAEIFIHIHHNLQIAGNGEKQQNRINEHLQQIRKTS